MVIGFTGTHKGMTDEQRRTLVGLLRKLNPAEFHHGDCIGSDAEAHGLARELLIPIIIHPPINDAMRAFCEGWKERRKPAPFLIRDTNIVNETELLIATPQQATQVLHSGTWATIRRARKTETAQLIIVPSGDVVEVTYPETQKGLGL